MKGKYVVIMLVLIVIAVVVAIYISMMNQFKKDQAFYEQAPSIHWVHSSDRWSSIEI